MCCNLPLGPLHRGEALSRNEDVVDVDQQMDCVFFAVVAEEARVSF